MAEALAAAGERGGLLPALLPRLRERLLAHDGAARGRARRRARPPERPRGEDRRLPRAAGARRARAGARSRGGCFDALARVLRGPARRARGRRRPQRLARAGRRGARVPRRRGRGARRSRRTSSVLADALAGARRRGPRRGRRAVPRRALTRPSRQRAAGSSWSIPSPASIAAISPRLASEPLREPLGVDRPGEQVAERAVAQRARDPRQPAGRVGELVVRAARARGARELEVQLARDLVVELLARAARSLSTPAVCSA